MRQTIFLTALIGMLAGCSTTGVGKDKFACGEGNEKNCSSVMESYQKSHGAMPGLAAAKAPSRPEELVASVPAAGVAIDSSRWPRPVLEPARVLRILVAPWIDEKETLHWPSYLFTELESRKWSYGQPDFRGAKQLVPLQIERRPASEPSATPTNPIPVK